MYELKVPTENFTAFANALPDRLVIPEGVVTATLNSEERNFQFALTRLISDVAERRAAELDGVRFQIKYGLTNKQMFSLARIAGECGEIDLKDGWQTTIQQLIAAKGNTGEPVGTCSCCCP